MPQHSVVNVLFPSACRLDLTPVLHHGIDPSHNPVALTQDPLTPVDDITHRLLNDDRVLNALMWSPMLQEAAVQQLLIFLQWDSPDTKIMHKLLQSLSETGTEQCSTRHLIAHATLIRASGGFSGRLGSALQVCFCANNNCLLAQMKSTCLSKAGQLPPCCGCATGFNFRVWRRLF